MHWYLGVWKKYAVFSGRARRKEYWFFTLFHVIASICLILIDNIIGTYDPYIEIIGFGLLSGIYALAILIPSVAVSVRRLHDTERSAWWLLIALIPVIGAIALLVFLCIDSSLGENRYGANPKLEMAAE